MEHLGCQKINVAFKMLQPYNVFILRMIINVCVYSCTVCHTVNKTSLCRYILKVYSYLLVINEMCIVVICARPLMEPVHVVIF